MCEHAALVAIAGLLGLGSPRVVPPPHDNVRGVRALDERLVRVNVVPEGNGQK